MILDSATGRDNRPRDELSVVHREMLFDESGIALEIVGERGYVTVTRCEDLPLEFKTYQRRKGLLIPVYSPDGITRANQLRPDNPRKDKKRKPLKYETPGGSKVILDVHPRMREAVRHGDGDLWITEGIKKADSLASRGLATVGLVGVWNWQRGGEMLPCWDHVWLEGRRVFIVFDSDVLAKVNVQLALERLVWALQGRGAEVLVVYLPDGRDGAKVGVDDYLAGNPGGTVTELKMLARRFEKEDLSRIRLSRDEELRALVEDVGRTLWDHEWKGQGGHSDRDVYFVLSRAAARSGKPHPDGIRLTISHGTLGLRAKVSTRTLCKAILRLEEAELLYRDNGGREADKAGAFVLRASVKYVGEKGSEKGSETRGVGEYDPGTLHLRSPRLMWSSPGSRRRRGTVRGTRRVLQGPPPEPRPAIKRLGKVRGAILDALDAAGGTATLKEIADALHRKRPRDLRRRNLPMLEEAGIVVVDGDVVTLAEDWLNRLEEARDLGGEIEAEDLTRRRLKEKREAFHKRHKTRPDRHPANAHADGWSEDLQKLPEPPTVDGLYRLIDHRVDTVRGPGKLWDVKGDEARVVLDSDPSCWVALDPAELLLEGAA
jgi:hypothetical protein